MAAEQAQVLVRTCFVAILYILDVTRAVLHISKARFVHVQDWLWSQIVQTGR